MQVYKGKQWLKDEVNALYRKVELGELVFDEQWILNHMFDLAEQLEEPEKVTVPEFVAELLERCRNKGLNLKGLLTEALESEKVRDWVIASKDRHTFETITRAWLDGYEVEEKRYRVPLHDGTYLVSDDDKNLSKATTYFMHQEDSGFLNRVHDFTEQEIKDIDERYWPFAVPVEEVTQ